jgi:hypothetical protein
MNYTRQPPLNPISLFIALFFFLLLVLLLLLGWPHYKVWKQGMDGQAALAEAEQSKMIQVQVAKAELEAPSFVLKRLNWLDKQLKIILNIVNRNSLAPLVKHCAMGGFNKSSTYRLKPTFPLLKQASRVRCNKAHIQVIRILVFLTKISHKKALPLQCFSNQ